MSFDVAYEDADLQDKPELAPTRSTGMAFSRKMWAKDSESKICTGCERKFTQFLRRHHCRACGKVFCDDCTKNKEKFLKSDKDNKMKKSRVCTRCSTDRAIDREEVLFKLLGPELGTKYFYLFKRAGHGELRSLTELPTDELDAVFNAVGVADRHRAIITKKLEDCKLTLLGGSTPMAMGLMGESMNGFDLSRSPEHRGSLIDNGATFGDIGRLLEDEPSVECERGRDSPKPNGKEGGKADIKQFKKKWQEELRQMENERQRRQAQLHVLDASMGAQAQTLVRLKKACDEEESKIGRLGTLEAEVTMLRCRSKVMENEEMWRDEEIANAAADHALEVADRKARFEKGEHKSASCQLCATSYRLLYREHHCRSCYRSVCDRCSRNRLPDRCCDWCMAVLVLRSNAWDREVKMSRTFRLTQLKHLKKASEGITANEPDLISRASRSPTPPRPRVTSGVTEDGSTMHSDSVLDRVQA